MKHFCVYWTCNRATRDKIRTRFRMPDHISVAGETECDIQDKDLELFTETCKRGFFTIRKKPL